MRETVDPVLRLEDRASFHLGPFEIEVRADYPGQMHLKHENGHKGLAGVVLSTEEAGQLQAAVGSALHWLSRLRSIDPGPPLDTTPPTDTFHSIQTAYDALPDEGGTL